MITGSEEADLASGAGPETLVRGSVDQLLEMAGVLRGHAVVLENASGALSRVEVTNWRGQASNGFQSVIEVQPGRWMGAAQAFSDAATAIGGYAASLGPARAVASRALQLYRDYLVAAAAVCSLTPDLVGSPMPGAVPTPGSGAVAMTAPERMLVGYRAQRLRDAADGVAAAGGVLAPVQVFTQAWVLDAEALRREAIATLVRARSVVVQAGDLAADAVSRATAQAPEARRFYQPTIRPPGAEEAAHGVLDVAGAVPGVGGVVANGVNATWYLTEGRRAEAGFAAASMVPLGKLAKAVGAGTHVADDATRLVDDAAKLGDAASAASPRRFATAQDIVARERADLDGLARDYGLTKIAPDTYQSPAGLVYAAISHDNYAEANRLSHVLMHGVEDSTKATHSVFVGGTEEVVNVVDEAWARRTVSPDGRKFVVDMGRAVGTHGETHIRVVVDGPSTGRFHLVTAFPE